MSFINLYFKRDNQNILMQAKGDMMFAELVLKYFQKTGLSENDMPQFLFNSVAIQYDTCKTLDELRMRDGSAIDVVIGKNVIGAVLFNNIYL